MPAMRYLNYALPCMLALLTAACNSNDDNPPVPLQYRISWIHSEDSYQLYEYDNEVGTGSDSIVQFIIHLSRRRHIYRYRRGRNAGRHGFGFQRDAASQRRRHRKPRRRNCPAEERRQPDEKELYCSIRIQPSTSAY